MMGADEIVANFYELLAQSIQARKLYQPDPMIMMASNWLLLRQQRPR